MENVSEERILAIGNMLCDTSKPMKQRFRALFTLKNLGGHAAINCISRAFTDSSALLKHELAYCLGQMRDPYAIPVLINVLEDKNQEPMVRHEAGEALGAIGTADVLYILEKHENDPVIEVAETCQLAAQRVKGLIANEGRSEGESLSPYDTVDPTPTAVTDDVAKLRSVFLDDGQPLFDRYKALFALRNNASFDAVSTIADGLFSGSALFRHEVAFVLGQLQKESSVSKLIDSLNDLSENEMVRHECAEALGSIATDECRNILEFYLKDEKRVVRESCEVALDMCDYENGLDFQYADALTNVP